MKSNLKIPLAGLCAGILYATSLWAEPEVTPQAPPTGQDAAESPPPKAARPEPKPLSENVLRGLKWLGSKQHEDGGWSIASDGPDMNAESRELIETSDVADTCMAVLAFLRAGNTPSQGDYAVRMRRGVEFVCAQIEAADKESLSITNIQGTKVQQKLGTYVDTFFAAQLLAEVQGKMPNEAGNTRVTKAVEKVIDKMERNQQSDGTWGGTGWATTLSQTMASKGLNRAMLNGVAVSEKSRDLAQNYGRTRYNSESGFIAGNDSAGVELYSAAAALTSAQEAANANAPLKAQAEKTLAAPRATPVEKEQAQAELSKIAATDKEAEQVREAVTKRLADQGFIDGFGSNGGEEFLSYLSISESLFVKGGEEWTAWDKKITTNLNHVQNEAGWWGGSHCITGGTFCTAAALMVLMVDRTPLPESANPNSAQL